MTGLRRGKNHLLACIDCGADLISLQQGRRVLAAFVRDLRHRRRSKATREVSAAHSSYLGYLEWVVFVSNTLIGNGTSYSPFMGRIQGGSGSREVWHALRLLKPPI